MLAPSSPSEAFSAFIAGALLFPDTFTLPVFISFGASPLPPAVLPSCVFIAAFESSLGRFGFAFAGDLHHCRLLLQSLELVYSSSFASSSASSSDSSKSSSSSSSEPSSTLSSVASSDDSSTSDVSSIGFY